MNKLVYEKLAEAEKIIIALSGGADSVALTHILYSEFPKKIMVAHVNHLIRGSEAFSDEKFVLDFCESLGIECKVLRKDIPKLAKDKGIGEEECGRIVRYEYFASLCNSNDVIATAHNADDNAETVLLNLIRGSGVDGLCGIPFVRKNIVRPILDMPRNEIENYCKENNLNYVTDSTNNENDYSRNKVRNLVMPLLKSINSNASENIGRTSAIMNQYKGYINSDVENILQKCRIKNSLDCIKLREYDEYILSEVVKSFLCENGIKNYEEKHIKKAVEFIFSSGAVMLPQKKTLSVKQNILSVFEESEHSYSENLLEIGRTNVFLNKQIEINEKKFIFFEKINKKLFNTLIDCDTIKKCLTVSTRKSGDYFHQHGRNAGKSLKKLFNEVKIPTHLRDKVLIVRDGDKIVFVEGFGVSEKYSINANSENILEVEIRENKENE